MKKITYLDYAATTPVDARVAEKMIACLTADGNFGNPASRSHFIGWQAEAAVEGARKQMAELLNADTREIVWTSGATESNNLAIKGVAQCYAAKGKHIITTAIEHKAVLDSCAFLESQGYEVTYLKPSSDGTISANQVDEAIRSDTILVSVMHVNNELGTINPIAEIGKICRDRGVLFHVDGAQSAGKISVDVVAMNIDMLSMSGHKIYGPKGVGILYVRRSPDVKVAAQIHGGGHERGMRSGTLPTHQIVGIGEAAAICAREMKQDQEHCRELRDSFLAKVSELPDISINGSLENRIVNNLNISFANVDGETLLMALGDIAVSSGSACNSASVDPSFVLTEIGVARSLALASIRFSFGRNSTKEEVVLAAQKVVDVVSRLRSA